MTLDPKRRQEIRERCDKATPGPWLRRQYYRPGEVVAEILGRYHGVLLIVAPTHGVTNDDDVHNGDFIAHARTDIPHLLARLDAVTGERDAYRARVGRLERLLDEVNNSTAGVMVERDAALSRAIAAEAESRALRDAIECEARDCGCSERIKARAARP